MTTTEAQPRTGVFLTQFPGASLTDSDGQPVDWTDHEAAHRAVMRLFAPRLAGSPERRRHAAGILYRVDVAANGDGIPDPTILVQSLVRPEVVPPVARSIEVSESAWTPATGAHVIFRVAVNPVRRTTRYFVDAAKKKPAPPGTRTRHARQTSSAVPVGEIADLIFRKTGGALTDVDVISHLRDTTETRRGRAFHRVIVDTVDAVATVDDPTALDRVRREGVGRAKAYGCGLLTIKRLG